MSIVSAIHTYDIHNLKLPQEGPRTVPVVLDFTLASEILIDGSQLADTKKLTIVQGVYIDNSQGQNAISLRADVTNAVITCPAGFQGYFTLIAINPFKIYATGGNDRIVIYLYNMPISPAVWSASDAPATLNGSMLVNDYNTSQALSGNMLRTKIVTNVTDCTTYAVQAKLTTAQAVIMSGTPGFYLNSLRIYARPETTGATANITVSIRVGTTVLFAVPLTVQSGAPTYTEPQGPIELFAMDNMNIKSNAAASLNVILSNALTAGGIDVIASGLADYTLNS